MLAHEPCDQVPWNGDLDYWITYLRDEKMLKERYTGEEGRFNLHRDLGVGFYLQGHCPYRTTIEGVDIKVEKNGNTTRTIYKTPVGTLTETWVYAWQTHSPGPTEFMVKTADDFEALKYMYDHTYYEADYSFTTLVHDRYVGDQGVTLVYTPHTPLMELVAGKAGIGNLVYAMADDEDGFNALFDSMKKKFDEASQLVIGAPAECIMIPENLSSESVGKNFYAKYMAPIHREWTKKIREAGKYSFIHMDGTLKGLIKEVSESGFDVIEACTPYPVGDMTLEEMRAAVCPDTIIWGGIPGGYFTDQLTDEEFDKYIIGVLDVMKKDRRLTLGVSDQVVPGARAERIARVKELVDRYGKYEN